MTSAATSGSPCRLCAGETTPQFTKRVLGKYHVTFEQCANCDSLQTEPPYWLDDSYADNRRALDVGAARRVLELRLITFFIWRIAGFPTNARLLDWGAGDGLFVRLMRDVGIDARYCDPFATNQYAIGFDADFADKFDMVTAFEVWEHLSNPGSELQSLFETEPEVHFATTDIYEMQGPDWPYLNCLTGRHVFFYSAKAIAHVAKQYGYYWTLYNNKYLFFHKSPLSRYARLRLKVLFKFARRRLLGAYFELLPKKGFINSDKQQAIEACRAELEGRVESGGPDGPVVAAERAP